MIDTGRVLDKLDAYLYKNDYEGAERHILYWLGEAAAIRHQSASLLLQNELCGLYRKLGREEDALAAVENALALVKEMGIEENVGAATTYINAGTVLKAFQKAEKALPLFEKALAIYEKELPQTDKRLGGLYNNMALALVDLKEFERAFALYEKAVAVMEKTADGMLEVAITYLNMASLKEAEMGLLEAEEAIGKLLSMAAEILDHYEEQNGYYAFVCEKCASVYGYHGFFAYEKELRERAEKIYARP